MIRDLEKIKSYLRSGCSLHLDHHGWHIVAEKGVQLKRWQMVEELRVPTDLVALLGAQGHIRIEQRLVGSAHWIPDCNAKSQQTA